MVKVLRSFVGGPLEPCVTGFAEELLRQGYSRSSAGQHVCFIAHLDRWMQAAGVGLDQLSRPVLERCLAGRCAAGYREYRSLRALAPLLDYLAPLGVLPAPSEVRLSPVEELLGRYGDYLLIERGLTAGTVGGYVDCVRPFVAGRLRGEVLDLAGVTAGDVTGFVLAACPGRAVGSAKLIVCALRSLLRWLHLTGTVPVSLAAVVPSVAGWRLSGLPKGLEPGQLRSLLASCDRRTPTGLGDYAIMLLLARLGLRAGEVARLGLDDVDWRRGEIVVLGKGNRAARLPLPALAPTLQAFFTDRLIRQRHASGHTVAAYRDTLRLLLGYAATSTGLPPSRLDLADLDAPLIAGFLDHLERERGNSVRTRNARLAAIHSLFRFAALAHPEHAQSISRVLAIPPKRFDRALITYLMLTAVDLAGDGVVRVAGDRGVEGPRPLVAGGALVGSVPGCSAW